MSQPFALSTLLLAVAIFSHASAENYLYIVSFVPCNPTTNCPQGSPIGFNETFALNGTLGQNLVVRVNDEVTFHLTTDVTAHPFVVCQRSKIPDYCSGVSYSDQLKPPMTKVGNITTVKFTSPGSYYYGSLYQAGMGGAIAVLPDSNVKSASEWAVRSGAGHKRSTSLLLSAVVALFLAMFV